MGVVCSAGASGKWLVDVIRGISNCVRGKKVETLKRSRLGIAGWFQGCGVVYITETLAAPRSRYEVTSSGNMPANRPPFIERYTHALVGTNVSMDLMETGSVLFLPQQRIMIIYYGKLQ